MPTTFVYYHNNSLSTTTDLSLLPIDSFLLAVYLVGQLTLKDLCQLRGAALIYTSIDTKYSFKQGLDTLEDQDIEGFIDLVSRVGQASILELLLMEATIDASQALQLGLVNQIYTIAEFQTQISTLSKLSISAIALACQVTKSATNLNYQAAEILERYAFALRFTHVDQKEGMQAFVEKRAPNFTIQSIKS